MDEELLYGDLDTSNDTLTIKELQEELNKVKRENETLKQRVGDAESVVSPPFIVVIYYT